jgi:hypothetical protein
MSPCPGTRATPGAALRYHSLVPLVTAATGVTSSSSCENSSSLVARSARFRIVARHGGVKPVGWVVSDSGVSNKNPLAWAGLGLERG